MEVYIQHIILFFGVSAARLLFEKYREAEFWPYLVDQTESNEKAFFLLQYIRKTGEDTFYFCFPSGGHCTFYGYDMARSTYNNWLEGNFSDYIEDINNIEGVRQPFYRKHNYVNSQRLFNSYASKEDALGETYIGKFIVPGQYRKNKGSLSSSVISHNISEAWKIFSDKMEVV